MSMVTLSPVDFLQLEFPSAVQDALQPVSNETERIRGHGAVMMRAAALDLLCKEAVQHHPIFSAEAAEYW